MSAAFPVTVFHNPACGTSRNVLAMVEAAGYRPDVVEYLQAGWTPDQLGALFAEAGLTPREALRDKGTPAAELGLLAPDVSDAAILAAMVEHPGAGQSPHRAHAEGRRHVPPVGAGVRPAGAEAGPLRQGRRRSGRPRIARPRDRPEREWCGRPGSNRHSFRNRILSPARLPVPPRPHRPVARFGRRAW